MIEEKKNKKDIINPSYFNLEEKQKSSLGYLTLKRIAISLKKHQKLKVLFDISEMKEAFHWFDKESLWEYFEDLKLKYVVNHQKGSEDSELYSLTDFLVWSINYTPSFFSELISYHLRDKYINKGDLELMNNIFSSAGFFYDGKLFSSSSFNPSIKLKVTDLLSIKLKELDETLYKTWDSIADDIISNNPDKSTTISAKSRKLIDGVLRKLTPNLKFETDEPNKIKKRLNKIFEDKKQKEIIEKVSNLITVLNESQAKGDHGFLKEDTAIFTFQITESILFFIFSNK